MTQLSIINHTPTPVYFGWDGRTCNCFVSRFYTDFQNFQGSPVTAIGGSEILDNVPSSFTPTSVGCTNATFISIDPGIRVIN